MRKTYLGLSAEIVLRKVAVDLATVNQFVPKPITYIYNDI